MIILGFKLTSGEGVDKIKGTPFSWNKLVMYCTDDSEVVMNDDGSYKYWFTGQPVTEIKLKNNADFLCSVFNVKHTYDIETLLQSMVGKEVQRILYDQYKNVALIVTAS